MAPPSKKAKISAPVAVGNIASFFGPKKGAEAKQAASPKAAASPSATKAPESSKPEEPAASPAETASPSARAPESSKPQETGVHGTSDATPTKDEVKPAPRITPEKPSPVLRRGPATPCMSTGKFHGFSGVKPSGWEQYNTLYRLRLNQLAGAARDAAEQRWRDMPKSSFLKDLVGVRVGQIHEVVVVGVLFKDLKGRRDVIDSYKGSKWLLDPWKEDDSCIYTEKDVMWLEDDKMRIELEMSKEQLVRLATGLVVAINATATQAGKLTVKDFCFPRMPLPAPLPAPSKARTYLALMSGLNFGSGDADSKAARTKAFEFLKAHSVQQLLICGGLFPEHGDVQCIKAAIREIEVELPPLCESTSVQVMPGRGEPTNSSLPQLQFHSSIITVQSPNFRTVGNPCGFRLGPLDILGHSGQPIKDLVRCAQLEPLEALEMCLKARHLAPTAPDTLCTQPFEEKDPFVMDAVPHILFSGGHARAERKWFDAGEQRGTQCIGVPNFSMHPAIVLVNLQDPRDVVVQEFGS